MAERSQHLRARKIAERVDVNIRTVRRWIANGTLPSVKVGGSRLVAEADLLRILSPNDPASGCPNDSTVRK